MLLAFLGHHLCCAFYRPVIALTAATCEINFVVLTAERLCDLMSCLVYGDCGISKKNLDIVRKAMLGVTQDENGTANYMFGDYKVKVAAKTGTAENSGSDHTTFICYAPYEKPEVAIAVVIEHGAKGRYSMQVAKNLLDAYFN
jgi:cell division protein FtsI/penicillin-binding protein 2